MGALGASFNDPQNGFPLNAGNWNAGSFGQQANTLASMASNKAEMLAAQSRDTGRAMMPGGYEGLLGQAAQWRDVADKGAGARLYGINSPFGMSNGNGGWTMPQVLGSFSVGGYQEDAAPAAAPTPKGWLVPGAENSDLFGPGSNATPFNNGQPQDPFSGIREYGPNGNTQSFLGGKGIQEFGQGQPYGGTGVQEWNGEQGQTSPAAKSISGLLSGLTSGNSNSWITSDINNEWSPTPIPQANPTKLYEIHNPINSPPTYPPGRDANGYVMPDQSKLPPTPGARWSSNTGVPLGGFPYGQIPAGIPNFSALMGASPKGKPNIFAPGGFSF